MIHGDRKSRILAGISANLFGQAVTVAVQVAGVPVLLHYWGVEYYGEWLLLFTLPAYLGLSDLGLGTVATTEISMCMARSDYQAASRIFRGAFCFVVSVGLALCLLFAAAVYLLPFHNWLNLKSISAAELAPTLSLLTAYTFLAIFLTLLVGAYRSVGQYGRGQVISNTFRLLEFSAMLISVALGKGIVEAAAAYLTVRLGYAIFVWVDIRRLAPWLRLEKFSWEWPVLRPLLPPSFSMMTVYMGQSLVSQGLVTIIGITLGAASVVLFSTVRTLCNFARQMIGVINLSVFSEYAISLGSQDLSAARRLHTRTVQANVALTLASVVGLAALGPLVLRWWTDGAVSAAQPFFALYLVYLLVNSLWLGSWNMLLGCNRHQSITRYYLLVSVAALALAWVGLNRFGIELVPVVLLLADAVFSGIVLRKSLEVLEQPAPEFLRQALSWPALKRSNL